MNSALLLKKEKKVNPTDEEKREERRKTIMKWGGIGIIIAGLVIVGVSDLIATNDSKNAKSAGQTLAGIGLIILGMVFTGLQVQ